MPQTEDLKKQVERQARRMKKAELEQSDLIGQTIYIGSLGIIFVLPVIVGVYLGHWLDSQAEGYSVRWTMSLMLAGIITGALNVYLFIRD